MGPVLHLGSCIIRFLIFAPHIILFFTNINALAVQMSGEGSEYQIKETMAIGTFHEDQAQNFLIRPQDIAVNSYNHIFVADIGILGVKVFDREGNCYATLGSIGHGPGEFQAITSITVNNANELIVADYTSRRFVVFDSNGGFKASYRLPSGIAPRKIHCTPNGNYLVLAKRSSDNLIIHLFDKHFKYLKSFLELPIVNEKNLELETDFAFIYAGEIKSDSSGRLYYVPAFYDGNIFLIENDQLVRILKAKRAFDLPYEYEIVKKRLNEPLSSKYQISRTNKEGITYLRRKYISGGINILDGGLIAHLLISYADENQEIGVEFFSSDEVMYEYVRYEGSEIPKGSWVASNGRWYVIDMNEIPTVREFALE